MKELMQYLKTFMKKNPIKQADVKLLLETKENNGTLMLKLLIECWNAERPHFGGDAGHRYDDGQKECAYCGRPKNWEPRNAGFLASAIDTHMEQPKFVKIKCAALTKKGA